VTPGSYVNWADGEPNNWEEQDCVQILPVWGHKWDDDFCIYTKKAICEKKGERGGRVTERLKTVNRDKRRHVEIIQIFIHK
jgi:hypothetical protein